MISAGGRDTLWWRRRDNLNGGYYDDQLYGGSGDDTLTDFSGNDIWMVAEQATTVW
jgi:Ca2+-binding RTX toxin-like protein